MLTNVSGFELYHDSSERDPEEDFGRIRARVSDFAEREGVEHDAIDAADWTGRELTAFFDELEGGVRSDREYRVGRQLLTHSMFVRLRPVLVIRYGAEGTGVDVYPHRTGTLHEGQVITIVDSVDELGELPSDGEAALPVPRIDRNVLAGERVERRAEPSPSPA